jgi:hypothetical protein
MKKLFYTSILGLILFELANVYFIMPMPGSQEMNSIDVAYFLYTWRWVFRGVFGVCFILGLKSAFIRSKFLASLCLIGLFTTVYATNFEMAADSMFLQTSHLVMKNVAENKVDTNRIILGIEQNGQSKAYPIQYLGYHHQVFDTIDNKPIIVTYCTVCRTGRVFDPSVNGQKESFRLVGMDHFNAMFEDNATKSWWRQATGEAIAGTLKGQVLPEVNSAQMALNQWLTLYPHSLIMQPDQNFKVEYDSLSNYESGKRKGNLTRRDSLSWQDKSWIVGVSLGNESKAYDWNLLEKQHIIYDFVDNQPIAILLANDNKSFFVLQRTDKNQTFTLSNDTLNDGQNSYNLLGVSLNSNVPNLKKINAYQEYWHSWRTFHPTTKRH